ncbi:hypothetical protein BpHYR1_046769 [Brachionus plicatilis]|uniref:Uncharacterized protein n=1 Tax=Brachionus plicatilis TaxID=10195 RepID=A0A3M7Q1F7_BRAPC|nr:hypothetical protein BpHYR1_046769 [Brachionus plicatilis]
MVYMLTNALLKFEFNSNKIIEILKSCIKGKAFKKNSSCSHDTLSDRISLRALVRLIFSTSLSGIHFILSWRKIWRIHRPTIIFPITLFLASLLSKDGEACEFWSKFLATWPSSLQDGIALRLICLRLELSPSSFRSKAVSSSMSLRFSPKSVKSDLFTSDLLRPILRLVFTLLKLANLSCSLSKKARLIST